MTINHALGGALFLALVCLALLWRFPHLKDRVKGIFHRKPKEH